MEPDAQGHLRHRQGGDRGHRRACGGAGRGRGLDLDDPEDWDKVATISLASALNPPAALIDATTGRTSAIDNLQAEIEAAEAKFARYVQNGLLDRASKQHDAIVKLTERLRELEAAAAGASPAADALAQGVKAFGEGAKLNREQILAALDAAKGQLEFIAPDDPDYLIIESEIRQLTAALDGLATSAGAGATPTDDVAKAVSRLGKAADDALPALTDGGFVEALSGDERAAIRQSGRDAIAAANLKAQGEIERAFIEAAAAQPSPGVKTAMRTRIKSWDDLLAEQFPLIGVDETIAPTLREAANRSSSAFTRALSEAFQTGDYSNIGRIATNAFKASLADSLAKGITSAVFDPLINGLTTALGKAVGGLGGSLVSGVVSKAAGGSGGGGIGELLGAGLSLALGKALDALGLGKVIDDVLDFLGLGGDAANQARNAVTGVGSTVRNAAQSLSAFDAALAASNITIPEATRAALEMAAATVPLAQFQQQLATMASQLGAATTSLNDFISAVGDANAIDWNQWSLVNRPTSFINDDGQLVDQFHEGGVVPGPIGQEKLALVQAGEEIIPFDRRMDMYRLLAGSGSRAVSIVQHVTGDVDAAVLRALRTNGREIGAILQNEILAAS